MLAPNPLSLFCAILLCLPLALLFTFTTPRLFAPFTATITTPSPVIIRLNHRRPDFIHEKPLPAIPSSPPQLPPPPPMHREINKPPKPRPKPEPEPPVLSSPPPPPPSPPPPPVDDGDDIHLFRQASKVNPEAHTPYPKIAFMFLTTAPLPFAPLWQKFFTQPTTSLRHRRIKTKNPYYNIYIHADPTTYNYTKHSFPGVFHNRLITSISKPTNRNSPTLAAAARRLLAYALLDDPSNSMFVLLSSTCVPLHSFNYTYTKLVTSNTNLSSYIEILTNEVGAYERWAARDITSNNLTTHVMLPEVQFDRFRIGSQFWALNRFHAREINRDRKGMWEKFKLPCTRWDVCYPEENYFPTLVEAVELEKKSKRNNVERATLTHVDWSGSWDGHPKMYNHTEATQELITRLRSLPLRYDDIGRNQSSFAAAAASGGQPVFLFARKFAPECLPPLLNISATVIFND